MAAKRRRPRASSTPSRRRQGREARRAAQGQGRRAAAARGASRRPRRRRRRRRTRRRSPRACSTSTRTTVIPALTKQFNYKNPNQVPRLQKIVVNMGLGAAVANPKIIDTAVEELTRHHRSEAGRHALQEGDRELQAPRRPAHRRDGHAAQRPHVGVPRPPRQRRAPAHARLQAACRARRSTARGTTRSACSEQIIFPEINYDRIDAIKGLNISFVTTAQTDEEGRALLQQLGMPFRAN